MKTQLTIIPNTFLPAWRCYLSNYLGIITDHSIAGEWGGGVELERWMMRRKEKRYHLRKRIA